MPLEKKGVDELRRLLTSDQLSFLESQIKQSNKSKWLERMTGFKGGNIDHIEDWRLVDLLDGGYGNRPYKCECGTPLRYQYIIKNKVTDQVYKLGSTCLENYTGISNQLIKDIIQDFHSINLEYEEILQKYAEGHIFLMSEYEYLYDKLDKNIIRQHNLGLPLSERQKQYVFTMDKKYRKDYFYKYQRLKLDFKQQCWLFKFSEVHQNQILDKLDDHIYPTYVNKLMLKLDKSIQYHMKLKLPLTDEQTKEIEEVNKQEVMKQRFESLTDEQKLWMSALSRIDQSYVLENLNNDELYYEDSEVKKMDLSLETKKHAGLQLPLLPKQFNEIQLAQTGYNPTGDSRVVKDHLEISYQELLNRHLNTLKEIRKKEDEIPVDSTRYKDWNKIQDTVALLKKGSKIDYTNFKLLLGNLIASLRITDEYL